MAACASALRLLLARFAPTDQAGKTSLPASLSRNLVTGSRACHMRPPPPSRLFSVPGLRIGRVGLAPVDQQPAAIGQHFHAMLVERTRVHGEYALVGS